MVGEKLKKYGVMYRSRRGKKVRIMVPYPRNPRTGTCKVCGKSKEKGEIKTTQLHHWHYAYSVETVKKNPLLALDNTVEVCFGCHRIADWLRNSVITTRPENFYRVIDVAKSMPLWMQDRFTKLCKLWLKERLKG